MKYIAAVLLFLFSFGLARAQELPTEFNSWTNCVPSIFSGDWHKFTSCMSGGGGGGASSGNLLIVGGPDFITLVGGTDKIKCVNSCQ